MILIDLGLAAACAFSGAALYINWAEQPARMKLDDVALLTEWKPSYARGFQMQATLAILAGVFGFAAFYFEHSFPALLGGLIILLNWPFTLIAILPTNKQLDATPNENAGSKTRALIAKWGWLHAVRTLLGLAGTATFLVAVHT